MPGLTASFMPHLVDITEMSALFFLKTNRGAPATIPDRTVPVPKMVTFPSETKSQN